MSTRFGQDFEVEVQARFEAGAWLVLLLLLMMRIVLATVCCRFGFGGLAIKLLKEQESLFYMQNLDANSKLIDVVTVADVDDEDCVGNSLLQIWELRFGHKIIFRCASIS